MKKRYIVLIVIVVLVIAGVIAMSVISGNLEDLVDLPIAAVDLNSIEDGVYTGTYDCFPVGATVDVTVSDHTIVAIDLTRHENGKGGAAEAIPQRVVDAQSLNVDAISGATYSSKVILLAIRDALSHPPN